MADQTQPKRKITGKQVWSWYRECSTEAEEWKLIKRIRDTGNTFHKMIKGEWGRDNI